MFQDFKTPLAIELGCSSGVLVCDGLGRVPDPTIRCASNSSCTSDDPCILHSPSFPVERAKLTDPRPKRAAKANGALDRPSQWVERRTMRVLCAPSGAAEMSKSATAERPFSVRQLRLLVSRPILFVFLKIYFQIFVFQDFKNEEYIMMS